MVYTIVYRSRASANVDDKEIEKILKTARKANAKNGITGILIFKEGVFLQVLEGERSKVLDTINRIKEDIRHQDVTIIGDMIGSEKSFASWDMAFSSLEDLNLSWIEETLFNSNNEIDPHDLLANIKDAV